MAVVDMLCAAASVLLLPLVQTVELKVSMHCYGCAKKVQKHISQMDGMRTDPSIYPLLRLCY